MDLALIFMLSFFLLCTFMSPLTSRSPSPPYCGFGWRYTPKALRTLYKAPCGLGRLCPGFPVRRRRETRSRLGGVSGSLCNFEGALEGFLSFRVRGSFF